MTLLRYFEGSAEAGSSIFWRDLIVGQMDADRMDYLLRDSYHMGVNYGRFDLNRLIASVTVTPKTQDESPRLGIEEGGWHAAEGLVLARYFMFTQVYFHKTRVAYDIHLREAMKKVLPKGRFPKPEGKELEKFLQWDDWRVLGLLADHKAGEHGDRLLERNHYRMVYHTPEVCSEGDIKELSAIKQKLGDFLVAEQSAAKSWYKTGDPDIPVVCNSPPRRIAPLGSFSKVIEGMKSSNQVLLYVKPDQRQAAERLIENGGTQ